MDSERLTTYLNSLIDRDIPSFDCMVYKNHEMIYRHMGGWQDKEKTTQINGNEIYLMFSMTKVMTMCCIMQLVEQGKVSLEDPVSKFLPAYKNLTYLDNGNEKKLDKPLLIKHLVSMQSGLDYNLNRDGIKRVLAQKGDEATTLEIVDSFIETPLKFVPGERFLYSLSHDVVAAVVEVASGMPFGEYMKKNIWEPLKLKHTYFAKKNNEGTKNLVQMYRLNEEEKIVPVDLMCEYQITSKYESGGAGLISCTEDYALLADAIACGGITKEGVRILKPETIGIMSSNFLGNESRHDLEYGMGRLGYGYGCGMQILMEPEKIGSAAPAGVFGWDGAAGSCITMDTKQKLSVVYVQHVRGCSFAYHEVHPTIRDIVFG